MSKERNILLAGVAALALVAGTSIASAQDMQDQNKGPQGKPPAAQQMNKTPATGDMGQNAQQQTKGPTAQNNKMQAGKSAAQTHTKQTHTNKSAKADRNRRTAAEQHRMQRPSTAQQQTQRNAFEGLQGNAAGGNVQLSEEQRTQLRGTVLNGPNVPRAGNVNFAVAAGTVIPRGSVNIVPVPPMLVQINPGWRHFRYFVWNDQLVIVDPRDMRIVAVMYV
jgi:type IV secretory pathway VirB10-like protein